MKTTFRLLIVCLAVIISIYSCKKDNAEPQKYTLTLTANPSNYGTTAGEGEYVAGKEVQINAVANDGYSFVNWKNGEVIVSTDSEFTYTTTDENVTLTANFEITTYSLSLSITPLGAGVVAGSGNYPAGASVNITATPNSGYSFVKWTEGASDISTNSNHTYTTTASNTTLTANFVRVYSLNVNTNLANSGVVTGAGNYQANTNVELKATPNIGYTFVNWTKGGVEVSTNTTYNYTTTSADETITANFSENTYEITLGAQSHASIGAFYSIAQNTVYTQSDASNNQTLIDMLCFYEVTNSNFITISSPGANVTGIYGGSSTDPMNWTTKRLMLFTPPATAITTTQFDALHQNDPLIQSYFNSSMTSSNKKAKNLAVDNIYAFKSQDNVYGLFKVKSVTQGADGSVQIVLKFKK